MLTILSGGQTGVDRAALDVSLELGLPVGGWCPAGRWAEDGPLPERYPLRETPSADPQERTAWNVRDSDATLVITAGESSPGTTYTLSCARALERPVYLCAAEAAADVASFGGWLRANAVRALNVAGPRESEAPGVYSAAARLVRSLLSSLASPRPPHP
jgi:hypothetical protein